MRESIGIVRDWQLLDVGGEKRPMNAASLVKLVLGHLALALVPDLDAPIYGDVSTRHVLSHTTGLPNWRPPGQGLSALRPPGLRWGYSGEGFVLLQNHLEHLAGLPIDELAAKAVFGPLGMVDSHLGPPTVCRRRRLTVTAWPGSGGTSEQAVDRHLWPACPPPARVGLRWPPRLPKRHAPSNDPISTLSSSAPNTTVG